MMRNGQIFTEKKIHILKIESAGFSERLDMRFREESRNDTKVSA